jgi:hypothetical protein
MNLAQLRDYIRVQLDMDAEELPNALLESYLQEAFTRTISMEVRWPFYETRWIFEATSDGILLTPEVDPIGIDAVVDSTNSYRLIQIANEMAEDRFVGMAATSANPTYYSIFGSHLVLWPTPPADFARSYNVRGHRLSTDWMATGASAVPDCDVRLHQLLAHYAIALCYAQQEDEVLEDTYMKRWQQMYQTAHSAICNPRHHRPLVFNGGLPFMPSYNPVIWSNPPVAP